MLTSELKTELGSLIRSLELKIQNEPALLAGTEPKDHLDRAIVALVKLRLELDT